MWLTRITTGLIFFIIFIASIKIKWLAWLLPVIIVAAGLIGIAEFHRFARRKGVNAPLVLSFIIALLIFADAYLGHFTHLLFILSFALSIILVYFAIWGGIENSVLRSAVVLMSTVYVALPLSILLYLLSPEIINNRQGLGLLVFIVVVTWATDTGAYGFGTHFGKHKLTPRLSPNKTVEGAIGGFFTGILVAVLILLFWKSLRQVIIWRDGILLGIILGIVTQIGDLAESAFKRDAQLKDSGNMIVGHGGILDVIDSLLLAIPVSYLYLHFISGVI